MYSENITCLFFLLMFYFNFIHGLDKNSVTTPHPSCTTEDDCILLRDCKNYMDLIESSEKPLKPPVVEFLRRKQCGFQEGYPKVCCSNDSKDGIFTTTPPKTAYKSCPLKSVCILLKDCKPYMAFISPLEKPLKPLIVDFLRAQHCGFQEGYPAVCCSSLSKNINALKQAIHDSTPHFSKKNNKLNAIDLEDVFTHVQTTTHKPSKSSQDEKIKEKTEAINEAFDLSDFFDFTGSFDLFRRKRFDDGSKLNLEIR